MIKTMFRARPLLVVSFLIVTIVHAAITVSYAAMVQFLTDYATGKVHMALLWVIVLTLAFALATALINLLGGYLKGNLLNASVNVLRDQTFSSFMQTSVSKARAEGEGHQISLLTTTAEIIKDSYITPVLYMYSLGLQFVFAITYAFFLNVSLTLFVLLLEIPSVALPILSKRVLQRAKQPVLENIAQYTGKVTNWLGGFATIRNFGRGMNFNREHRQQLSSLLKVENRDLLIRRIVSAISQFLGDFVYLGTWVIGAYFILAHALTLGKFLAFTQLAVSVSFPIESFSETIPEFFGGAQAFAQYQEKLRAKHPSNDDNLPSEDDVPATANTPALEYHDVAISRDKRVILHHVNLAVDAGAHVVIIGESGAGKSTLVNTLFQYQEHYDGQIKVFGRDLGYLSHTELVKMIGIQEQKTYIFDGTVRDNVTLYATNYADAAVEQALITAGLAKDEPAAARLMTLPVKTDGGALSGGERQRLGLARNLITHKSFYVFDELSSGLDPASIASLEETLFSLDVGFLYITHNYTNQLLHHADQVLRVADGTLQQVTL